MLKFGNVEIKNFLSIGEATLDLSRDDGFTLIDAENHREQDQSTSNGSGKSSLFESLIWALTGETIRGYKDVVNKYQEDDCAVKVSFNFKGYDWVVERSRKKSGSQNLRIWKDNQELEYKGLRDAEQVLEKCLPELTMKFLGSTVVLGQGLPQRFTNNSPAGRKAVLEELSNADYMIEHVKENIKKRNLDLSERLRVNQDAVLKATSEKGVLESVLKNLQTEEDALKAFDIGTAQLELEALVVKGKEASAKVEQLKVEEDTLTTKAKEAYTVYTDKESAKKEELSKLSSDLNISLIEVDKEKAEKLAEFDSTFNELDLARESRIYNLKEEISHCDAIIKGGYCKYCGQKLSGVSEEKILEAKSKLEPLQEELNQVSKEFSDARVQHEEEKKNLKALYEAKKTELRASNQKKVAEVEDKYNTELNLLKEASAQVMVSLNQARDSLRSAQDNLLSLREQYQEKNTQIKSHESKLAEVANKIASTQNSIKVSEGTIKTHSDLVEKLNERLKVNKQMDTFASRDFRGILLEGIVCQLDSILRNYAKEVYGEPLTSFYQEGNTIGIQFDGKEYESLSGGEKQKLDILIQLSLRDLIIQTSGIEANVICMDELFDALDILGCESILKVLMNLGISTYVITHRKELHIPYDRRIIVIKNSDGIAHLEEG